MIDRNKGDADGIPNPSGFRRILLKLSGEALAGEKGFGLDPQILSQVADELIWVAQKGIEIATVLGGGNIIRGAQAGLDDRVMGDQMGMLGTLINALALKDAIQKKGVLARIYSGLPIDGLFPKFEKESVLNQMKNGTVIILGGGTGSPFFTTDTGAALRGAELEVDIILKGTKVDGIYSGDPKKDSAATRYESITYHEIIDKKLGVMDMTAISFCMENNIPIVVFDMTKKQAIREIIQRPSKGTWVHP